MINFGKIMKYGCHGRFSMKNVLQFYTSFNCYMVEQRLSSTTDRPHVEAMTATH